MEASSKTYVGGAPEKAAGGEQVVGAQLIAEELKKQVCENTADIDLNRL
jgi:hypothetical protein